MFDFITRSGEIRQFHVEKVFKLFSSFPMVCKGKIKKFCVKKRHKTTYYFFPPESFRGIYNLSSTWRSPKYVTNMAKNLYFIFEVLLVLVRSGPTSFADTLSVNTWMWPFIVNNDGNIQYVSRLDFGKDTVQKYPDGNISQLCFANYSWFFVATYSPCELDKIFLDRVFAKIWPRYTLYILIIITTWWFRTEA